MALRCRTGMFERKLWETRIWRHEGDLCDRVIRKDASGGDWHWELWWRPLISGVVRDLPRWP